MKQSFMGDSVTPAASAAGRVAARAVFKARGNHSEVHLTEAELAAVCALAAHALLELAKREARRGADRTAR
jgi:hypothetical protein